MVDISKKTFKTPLNIMNLINMLFPDKKFITMLFPLTEKLSELGVQYGRLSRANDKQSPIREFKNYL